MMRLARTLILAITALAALTPAASGAAEWRLDQPAAPPPPQGVAPAPYPVALGAIADIKFRAPNRGLMIVGGNGAPGITSGQDGIVKEGIYAYDGQSWTPYANVCGGRLTNRVAWAGPSEFWTIATNRVDTRSGESPTYEASTLCHFKDGLVVGSYATARSDADAYLEMQAAECLAPDDCWFGGRQLEEPNPQVFMLHWNGKELRRVDGPQARPITDLEAFDGATYGALTVSGDAGVAAALLPELPEPRPLLLRSIPGGTEATIRDPFVSSTSYLFNAGKPTKAQSVDEFRALDADGQRLWAAGGPATSGPDAGLSATKRRGILLAVREAGAASFREIALDPKLLPNTLQVVDLAAVPGTNTAWLAISDGTAPNVPMVVHVDDQGAVLDSIRLPLDGDTDPNALAAVTGGASRIDCAAADECWLATTNGWLYHLSAGPLERDDNPYFNTFIATRPADATTVKDLSDAIPVDDSGADLSFLDATITLPPELVDPDVPEAVPAPTATRVRVKALSRKSVEVSFRLSDRAKVKLQLLRGKKVVASAKPRVMKAGTHKLRFRVSVKRWPNKIKLDVSNA